MFSFTLKAILLLVVLTAGTVYGQIEIADVKDLSVVEGCSCSVQTLKEAKKPNSDKVIFLSESGSGGGWMNINGKDTKLTLVRSTENDVRESGVGSRYYEEYSAKGIEVRIDFVTSWVCPPEDEACEVAKYDITILVTKGEDSKIIEAKGVCGC